MSLFHRDYLLRMIEQIGRALLQLRDRILRRKIEPEEVRTELHAVAAEAGIDLDIARRLDPASLLLWLAPAGEIDEPRFWLLAELLYLGGLHLHEEGQDGAADAEFSRALALFERLPAGWRPVEELPSVEERMEDIRGLMDG
jgi:hypothetical protein